MNQKTRALLFAARLYRAQVALRYVGYVRRDPMARLSLGPGRDDPYSIYEELRTAGTMVPTRLGNWVTTSHELCGKVLRDRRFGVRPIDQPPAGPAADEFDLSLLDRNPPDHTRLRRLAAPAFSPRHMAAYAPRIERTVHSLLDQVERSGQVELQSTFSGPLPIAVITDLLGVPDADAAEFSRYGATLGSALDGIRSLRHAAQLVAANAALSTMMNDLFALRRTEPRDDVVSRLVAAEGDQIDADELLGLTVLLLVAGFETTVNLLGNAVLALLSHPEQWQALVDDPGLAGAAVEETLRYDPPVQRTARAAFEDLDLGGVRVVKDQFVVLAIAAANRDPGVYDQPNRFDITRAAPAEHLAFSAGIHYCLGAPLARLEATVALAALAERFPRLRVAGPVRRRNATIIRGPRILPVAV